MMPDIDGFQRAAAVRSFIENKFPAAPIWFGEEELDRALRHLRDGKPEKVWLAGLRNTTQRFCNMGPNARSTVDLPITPCRACGRDIPFAVWTALGLAGRPKLDYRGVAAHGWVIAPDAPRDLLRWFERS